MLMITSSCVNEHNQSSINDKFELNAMCQNKLYRMIEGLMSMIMS